jgi:hypothetical protein
MPQPLVVSIPHSLGKDEAVRRLKSGLGNAQSNFGHLFKVQEETWTIDHLQFRAGASGERQHRCRRRSCSPGSPAALAPRKGGRGDPATHPPRRVVDAGEKIAASVIGSDGESAFRHPSNCRRRNFHSEL